MRTRVATPQPLLEHPLQVAGEAGQIAEHVDHFVFFQLLEVIPSCDRDVSLLWIPLSDTDVEILPTLRISEHPVTEVIVREVPHHHDGRSKRAVSVARERFFVEK